MMVRREIAGSEVGLRGARGGPGARAALLKHMGAQRVARADERRRYLAACAEESKLRVLVADNSFHCATDRGYAFWPASVLSLIVHGPLADRTQ